jgi:hypothetical protein
MLASRAHSRHVRRVAALVAALSIALLLGLSAHAHADAPTDPKSCAICAVAHDSAAPIPPQVSIDAPLARELAAVPEATAIAKQSQAALPTARAPPSEKPNT